MPMAGSRVPFQGHPHQTPPIDWPWESRPKLSEPPKTPTSWCHCSPSPPPRNNPGSPIPMSGAPAPSPPPCFSIASPQPMSKFARPASEYDFLPVPGSPAELQPLSRMLQSQRRSLGILRKQKKNGSSVNELRWAVTNLWIVRVLNVVL